MLADLLPQFPRLALAWMDQSYRGDRLKQWLAAQPLQQEIVQKPRCWLWCPPGVEPPPIPAFTVLPHHWIVERTFGWLGRWRFLTPSYSTDKMVATPERFF